MTHNDFLSADAVILDIQAADSEQVLGVLADALTQRDPELASRRDDIYNGLVAREDQGSTGQQGVGIPHIKLPGISKVSMVVGIHKEGLDFDALDGEPVHVFFSVIRPEEGAEEHLDVLRWISGIAGHQDFVSFARQASEAGQVIDLLTELSPV
ncbi:MAG: PTS sugar transporter subunit IIA [Planctomycetota bacterium]|jgi:PTS system fructose-specific IIA component/PTS system nitrogen regulatory IIA component|nr:PTS sugar transporter subunit IIA [Planctomycetota bacterium]MDP6941804.1 PTS sugar transporter subunit IIA [Planctomycetota bacterium]